MSYGSLALVALAWAYAQQPAEFSAAVEVVHLDVFVSRDGEPVADLTAANFEVRDNGARQDVEIVLSAEAPPLHVVLILDTSASVAGARLDDLKAAAAAFLDGLGEGDRVTLTSFSHRTRLEAAPGSDPRDIQLGSLVGRGGTALFDAVYSGLLLADTRLGRPMIVVFSDGEDGVSWLSADQVLQAARESDAVVFAIHSAQAPMPVDGRPIAWTRRLDPTAQFLRHVAEDSGGELWGAEKGGLRSAFRHVLAQLQSHYLLRFSPDRAGCADWHELDVKLKGRKGKVRTRRGYSVPCQTGSSPAGGSSR